MVMRVVALPGSGMVRALQRTRERRRDVVMDVRVSAVGVCVCVTARALRRRPVFLEREGALWDRLMVVAVVVMSGAEVVGELALEEREERRGGGSVRTAVALVD